MLSGDRHFSPGTIFSTSTIFIYHLFPDIIMAVEKKAGLNTSMVHAGYHPESGPVNLPIHESSACAFKDCDDGAERFTSREKEGIYSRLGNPTVKVLEKKIAALEGGYGGIAAASGMAAVDAVYSYYLAPDSHVVATASVYGPSRSLLEKKEFYGKWKVEATFVDTADAGAVRKAIRGNTRLLYVETPANPTLAITKIAKMAEIAEPAGIPLVVDNTFCSPYLQNPLAHGADAVLHSLTKSISGHANVVGGMIVTKTEKDYYGLKGNIVNRGGILSPHDANLINTGVKTLGLRMEKMQVNAMALARYLERHEKISWVAYPGLESHPQHRLVGEGRQMRGPGGIISFGVKGGYEKVKALLDNFKLVLLAVSLGGVESLAQHPASMTHAAVPEESRAASGITDDLVRLSAGIEDLSDLLADFEQAFEQVNI